MAITSEREIEIYARIGNFEGFRQANSAEYQVQGEVKLKDGEGTPIRNRIRKYRPEDTKSISKNDYTIKTQRSEKEGIRDMLEATSAVEGEFSVWWLTNIAKKVIVKTRYRFVSQKVSLVDGDKEYELPEVVFEVDVFYNKPGSAEKYCPVCKIDIEMDNIIEYLEKHHPEIKDYQTKIKISHLPFEPQDPVLATDADDKLRAKIADFWDKLSIPAEEYFNPNGGGDVSAAQ